ncbi:MAG: hypothetical protein EOP83_06170 [Verrucomicrobiaceae bacterium]|nr:MAG: hypothetical protein EOP83_06170 [Verrucomicrobiaceae bacterium]
MHPISNTNFGNQPGKIKVTFHNGNSSVDGFIVKQTGSSTFVVANANAVSTTFTCRLADKTDLASNLAAGFCTITATPFGSNTVEHVSSIQSRIVHTTEGNSYSWFLGTASIPGSVNLNTI